MNLTFQNIGILLGHPLFTVLGLAIFLAGCSTNYSYTHTRGFGSEISTSKLQLREHIKFHWISLPTPGKYTGSQDVRELMEALDAGYNRGHSKTEVSLSHTVNNEKISYSSNLTEYEIDARYPRAEWLQMLLERGITVENFGDYSRYLLKRHTLALLEDNPNLWQSEILDIPSTDNWETYKAAYIDKLIKDHTKKSKTK